MISRLKLVDFRGTQDLDWQPGPLLNVVLGANDAGKTTIRQAIEWALCGRVTGVTDERGAGSEDLVRVGRRDGSVSVQVTSAEGEVTRLRRSVGGARAKLELEGVTGTTRTLEDALADRVGRPDVLSAALATGRVLDRPPAEQQALIGRLSGAVWAPRDIAAPEILSLLGFNPDGAPLGVDDLQAIAKAAAAARAEEGRVLKSLKADLERLPAGRALSPADAQKAAEQLLLAKEGRDAAVAALGALGMAPMTRKRLEGQMARLRAEIEEMTPKIARWSASAAQLDAMREACAAAEREVQSRRAALTAAQAEHEVAAQTLAGLRADAELLTQAKGGVCPTCRRDGLDAQAAYEVLEAEIARSEAEVDKLLHAARTAFESASEAVAGLRQAEQAVGTAEANAAALERAREIDRRNRAALDEATKELAALAGDTEDAGAYEGAVVQADAQVERLQKLLAEHRAAEASTERRADLEGQIRDQQALYAALDDLCHACGNGGALWGRAEEAVKAFLARVSDGLGQEVGLGGGRLQVDGLDPRLLSRSGRLRLGVSLQVELARAAGAPVVVVDDLDALDHEHRNALLQTVLASGMQAIVLCALQSADPPTPPAVDGVAYWLLRDGAMTRLGGGAA